MATVEEVITSLQKNYNPKDHIVCDIWTAFEIKLQAKNDEVNLSDEQVNEIVNEIHVNIDANEGINHEVVSRAVMVHAHGC